MNYYEHHLGDYAQATSHLSFTEDAAYCRLLRKYYAEEEPIPAELKSAQRLVSARTKEERDAVKVVLEEFFILESDGWHNKRADSEIARFRESEPDRTAKRENAKERQRRARQHRAELFEALRGHGIVPAYDTATRDLVAQLSRVTSQPVTTTVTQPVTRDNTATHTPDTRHQTPERSKAEKHAPDGADDLFPGVRPEIVRDFRKLRVAKRAPVTQTALTGIIREAGKAGLTLDAALAICCERGWSGFKAEWLQRDGGNVRAFQQKADSQPTTLPRLEA